MEKPELSSKLLAKIAEIDRHHNRCHADPDTKAAFIEIRRAVAATRWTCTRRFLASCSSGLRYRRSFEVARGLLCAVALLGLFFIEAELSRPKMA